MCLIVSLMSYLFYSFDFFAPVDNRLFDQHFVARKQNSKIENNQIVILAIDDYSIEKFKIWPWPRRIYADLLDVLREQGAKVVAFDVNFDSYSGYSQADDELFAEALRKKGKVILARDLQVKNRRIVVRDPIEALKEHSELAIVNPFLDKDYFIRRYNLVSKQGESFLPYFAFAVAAQYLDIPVDNKNLFLSSGLINFQGRQIPLDKRNKMVINYQGGRGTFPTIPVVKVLEEDFFKLNPGLVKNKIVLIGATAVYLQDMFPTPTSMEMPGVEIHANTVYTILNNKFFKNLPHIFYLFLILIPSLLITWFTWTRKAVKGFFVFLLVSYGFVWFSSFMFTKSFIVQISANIFAFFITYLTTILLRFLNEENEKKEIKNIFNQYVSPAIVTELLKDKEKLKLGGDKKQVSIFFSDIRAFTTFSEAHTPEEIVSQLNEYLNAMTEVIFEYQGTLDKFVGDEIMAVWGSPLEQENHAIKAVECALRQLEVLRDLQKKWKAEGKDILDIGIGINSGEVVVGNIGAEKYKDYTVIGDAVNLAARLEAYTRNVSKERNKTCWFLISDNTKRMVEHVVETEYVGEITVKGKTQAIKVWEVLSKK